jgi:hypothetical protein
MGTERGSTKGRFPNPRSTLALAVEVGLYRRSRMTERRLGARATIGWHITNPTKVDIPDGRRIRRPLGGVKHLRAVLWNDVATSGTPAPSGQIPPPWAWWENEAPTTRAACSSSQAVVSLGGYRVARNR